MYALKCILANQECLLALREDTCHEELPFSAFRFLQRCIAAKNKSAYLEYLACLRCYGICVTHSYCTRRQTQLFFRHHSCFVSFTTA